MLIMPESSLTDRTLLRRGQPVSIEAFTHLSENISANTTIWFFFTAADAVFGWGALGACNVTTVLQKQADGELRELCPPLTGSAYVGAELTIPEYMPAVRKFQAQHHPLSLDARLLIGICLLGRMERPVRCAQWYRK
jgi:hypothetical protein